MAGAAGFELGWTEAGACSSGTTTGRVAGGGTAGELAPALLTVFLLVATRSGAVGCSALLLCELARAAVGAAAGTGVGAGRSAPHPASPAAINVRIQNLMSTPEMTVESDPYAGFCASTC